MKCCVVERVPYRLPGTTRLVWGIVLARREGLSLLVVQKPDDKHPHTIVIASENMSERVYEDTNASRFSLEQEDLSDVGKKLRALSDKFAEADFERFFRWEDFW